MPITATCLVEIDGNPLPADLVPLLTTAHVDDSQRVPDLFVLRFRDGDRAVIGKTGAKVGSSVRISVQTPARAQPSLLMVGEVTALEAEFDGGGAFTVIRGYDPAHRLFRGRRTEAYTQMTAADIATKVARRAGLRIGTIEATSTVYEHVTQAGSTDWAFLEGLASSIGFELAVRDGSFSFSSPVQASAAPTPSGDPDDEPLVLRPGADLLRFRAVVTAAEQVKEVEVRGWDIASKKALVATAPAKTRSADLDTVSPTTLARTFGDATYVSSAKPHHTQAEVDARAVAIAETIAGAFAEFEGVVRGNPDLHASTPITVEGLGAPFNGKYVVTTTRHIFDPGTGYTTSFKVTGRQERSLLGLASGGGSAVPSRMFGVYVALVTDIKDPAKQGRVKVGLPWLSTDYASGWARTMQLGAGNGRGLVLLPEVGDEVLVAFEQGDSSYPVVVGGLYNGVDQPPTLSPDTVDEGTGAVNRRSLVSRRGHHIDLLDQSGQADGITLETHDGGLAIRLDGTATEIAVASDGTVTITGSRGVAVDAGGAALDLSGGNISIKASTGLTIDGGASCSISAALVKIN